MQVEVNGVMYEPKPQRTKAKSSRGLALLGAMAAMYAGYDGATSSKKNEPRIDIVKEYGLIQLKQSHLSRSQRNWVEYQFEKTYQKVEPNEIM